MILALFFSVLPYFIWYFSSQEPFSEKEVEELIAELLDVESKVKNTEEYQKQKLFVTYSVIYL